MPSDIHSSKDDESFNTKDIQQQVEELKLYRDKQNSDKEFSSSESSSGSNDWKYAQKDKRK